MTFTQPISSSTGVIWAVFEIPAHAERTGTGDGGGPGLGYSLRPGRTNGHLSADGVIWAPLREGYAFAVEAIPAALMKGAGASTSLSDLQSTAPEGWWTNLDRERVSTSAILEKPDDEASEIVSVRHPLVVAPNPFNPRTRISFYVEKAGPVRVEIFDVRGRSVRVLESRIFTAGAQQLVWEGADDGARAVASGVYFIRVSTSSGVFQQRVALVR